MGGRYMNNEPQKKYSKSPKGKEAMRKARETYDQSDPERRRRQKREYMRRKRLQDPDYGKSKNEPKRA